MSNQNSSSTSSKAITGIVSVIVIIIVALFGGKFFSAEGQGVSNVEGLQNVTVQTGKECISKINVNEDVLRVYYFDVGQADSILIVNKGESMLIDAGKNDSGKKVVDNLKKIGITNLTYVVGTHPHEDHVGSLKVVGESADIKEIYVI